MSVTDEVQRSDQSLRDQFSDNALTVLERRYLRKDQNGEPVESLSEMFTRVAYHVASAEKAWNGNVKEAEDMFYQMLTRARFLPNSPTFTGAGTPLGQLAACFVLPIQDDMGREPGGIFQSLRDAALIQQTGGGNGFSFSRLRPKDSLVASSMGKATGPLGFLRVYDQAFGEIAQGGTRRGANMAVLRVDHPDIEAFISCKTSEQAITNFNISVGVLDDFMRAVEDDEKWTLRFPDVRDPKYRNFHGTLEKAEAQNITIDTYHEVRARDVFDQIVKQAWMNGEPGMLFLDTAQSDHPLPELGRYESTNPCGEQFLMPYENCCLGSVNLAEHLTYNNEGDPLIQWDNIAETVRVATRFLDDVVSANAYVPGVPQLREAAHRARRIGLGIMGLADLLYHMGVRYGTTKGQELAALVMEFIRYHTMLASIDLAKEREPFPAIHTSIYDPDNLTWRPKSWPSWLNGGPTHKWGRPDLNWEDVLEGIRTHGIRNSTQLTIAPTGTIATVAGIEGYGCEPVFALAYTRHVRDGDREIDLRYVSPRFEAALKNADIKKDKRERILSKVTQSGSCQNIEDVPEAIQDVFVVSGDIPAEGHIRMQAALQIFTDASISKTVNFPVDAEPEDVAEAFLLAWHLGCKGLTVYVAGSRQEEVLETEETRRKKDDEVKQGSDRDLAMRSEQPPMDPHVTPRRPRPNSLQGTTYRSQTPLGTAYVTINTNGDNQPFEVFLNVGKAGSDTAAVAEAMGRLISLVLRLPSPVEPKERLTQIVDQLSGIGGRRPSGFGHNRVLSLPDGVAGVLESYLHPDDEPVSELTLSLGPHTEEHDATQPNLALFQVGDLCPECGQATLINTEGCRRCYACGHSEC